MLLKPDYPRSVVKPLISSLFLCCCCFSAGCLDSTEPIYSMKAQISKEASPETPTSPAKQLAGSFSYRTIIVFNYTWVFWKKKKKTDYSLVYSSMCPWQDKSCSDAQLPVPSRAARPAQSTTLMSLWRRRRFLSLPRAHPRHRWSSRGKHRCRISAFPMAGRSPTPSDRTVKSISDAKAAVHCEVRNLDALTKPD